MVTKRRTLANVYVWGVVGCALGILASPALSPMSFSRVPALPGRGVTYFAWGPGYALRLTQESATFLIASPHDPTELIELQTDLPEPEARSESVVQRSSRANYFSGVNRSSWARNVPSYGAFNSAWIQGSDHHDEAA